VAAEAAVIAIENGYQVAVLAPTEILATQHGLYFKQILSKLGYVTALLTGSFTAREKAQLKKLVAEGLVQVVIGTHALLEKTSSFRSSAWPSSMNSTVSACCSASAWCRRACIPTCW